MGGDGALANGAAGANGGAPDGAGEGAADGAFDRSKFDKLAKRPPAGPAARKGAARKAAPGKDKPAKVEGKGKPGKVQHHTLTGASGGWDTGVECSNDCTGCSPRTVEPIRYGTGKPGNVCL